MTDSPLLRLGCLAPLHGFEAAARHRSFTLAAEELSLTQSAISRQIQGLEDQLGVSLFVRKPRQLVLTAEGEKFLMAVQAALKELSTAVRSLQATERRPVTLTTTIGIAALWLVPRLSRFLAEHPEIDVRISANNRLVDLRRDGIDLALRYVPAAQAAAGSHYLFGEEFFPVATPEVLGELAHRPPCGDDIARLTLLNFDDPTPEPWLGWPSWLEKFGIPDARPKAVLHFNHYDQLIAAAVAGQGLAIGRSALLGEPLASGRLQALAQPYRHRSLRHYYLAEAIERDRPEVAVLRDWLLSEAVLERQGKAAE